MILFGLAGASSALALLRGWARREFDRRAQEAQPKLDPEVVAKLGKTWAGSESQQLKDWELAIVKAETDATPPAPQDCVYPSQPGDEGHRAGSPHIAYPFNPAGRVPIGTDLNPLHWAHVWWPDGCWEFWWLPMGAVWSTVVQKGSALGYTDPATGLTWTPEIDRRHQVYMLRFGWEEMNAHPRLYPLGHLVRRKWAGPRELPNNPANLAASQDNTDTARCSRRVAP